MINREISLALLNEYIKSESLLNHCKMVAKAMESYAIELGLDAQSIEDWWASGLLHDLDWEQYPNEHPNYAVNNILPQKGYSDSILNAIRAHAPDRTGKQPESLMERYLFACDEICGFINAVSLIRPTKFVGLEVKSITKRLKEPRFAANVSREDINNGVSLINKTLEEHIAFLLKTFSSWNS